MNNAPEGRRALTRREFFPALARLGAVAALAAVAAAARRPKQPVQAGRSCVNRGICRGCRVLDGCELPQALSAKQHRRRL